MEESFEQEYKERIEKIKDDPNFEELGDREFLHHEDPQARILWAFHRPSGACPEQIQDDDPLVSAMAFNNARNSALERFRLLHPDVLRNASLRIRIQNRARMLFRSMADEDFEELVRVLREFPDYLSLALHQIVNGRRWKENHANMIHASRFLDLAIDEMDETVMNAFLDRLEQIDLSASTEEVMTILERVKEKSSELHPVILDHYRKQIQIWMEKNDIHPLKKILIDRKMKEIS